MIEFINEEPIEPDKHYGIDGQYIYFTPQCKKPIVALDIIEDNINREIQLQCINPGVFRLFTNDTRDFVTGYDLCKEFVHWDEPKKPMWYDVKEDVESEGIINQFSKEPVLNNLYKALTLEELEKQIKKYYKSTQHYEQLNRTNH